MTTKIVRNISLIMAGLTGWLVLCGCSDSTPQPLPESGSGIPTTQASAQLRLAFENAKPGDVIEVPPGIHQFKRSLVLNSDGVTIRGAGMDKSVLSFKGQITGAEGVLINAGNFVIEDLAIEDTAGDGLKINEGHNIVVRRVRAEWTDGPSVKNGAYGIYPVQTTNTLVEGCIAIGASDAGIYVGQSRQVIVRNNTARYNVAGIEIENTVHADVYDNRATDNTGGILVFNMPQIPLHGHSTRIYNNRVTNNNTANFAAPGTAVSGVPAGSGIVINANDKVEIFGNTIHNNNTANILVSSYFSASYAGQREQAEEFDPYPEQIHIYDNSFSGGGANPGTEDLTQIRNAVFGPEGHFPDVIWDGFVDPEGGSDPVICINNGDAQVLNVDAPNAFANPRIDSSHQGCHLPKLAAVTLAPAASPAANGKAAEGE